MTLDRLILTNFKNYTEADITLCGNVNCFVGNNGAGKTNLLDAVYYLSFCKSYFNPVDVQNIRMGEDFFAIHGHYGDDVASCLLRRGKGKEMRWNKKPYKTLAEHIGKLPLVMVSPADQQIITGGSDMRRRFIDGILSQTDNKYLLHLLQYNKALEMHNKLLKQMWDDRLWDEGMVAVYDAQLSTHDTSSPTSDRSSTSTTTGLPVTANRLSSTTPPTHARSTFSSPTPVRQTSMRSTPPSVRTRTTSC